MKKPKLNGEILIMKISPAMKLQLQFAAEEQHIPMSELVRQFIEQGLKRKGKK